MNAIRFAGAYVAALALLVVTAAVAGELLLRFVLGRAHAGVPARAAFTIGAGWVVLATLGWALGTAGRLDRSALLVAFAALHVAGAPLWREAWRARPGAAHPRRPGLGLVAAALFATAVFALALYPPMAFDETLYHLPFARAFADSAALPFLPDLRFPVFPVLAEVLSAGILVLGTDVATHLVAWVSTFATAALLWDWGRRVGEVGGSATGVLAAAIWLGNPLVVYLAGTDYVEPLLALFVTAGAYAFWLWRDGGDRGWLALAGIFAGAAAGTKYLGLYFVAAFAAAALLPRSTGSPEPFRKRGAAAARFLLFALLALAPWYGRIIALSGNPLFPYLSGVFGENAWTPVHFRTLTHDLPASGERLETFARAAGRLATLPWDAVFRRARVGSLPPLSPFYILALLLALVAAARRLRRRSASRRAVPESLRSPLGVALLFVVLTAALPADVRYLVSALPILGLVGAAAIAAFASRLPTPASGGNAVAAVAALLLALPGAAYAGYRLGILGPPPATPAARAAFLERTVPFYPAVAFVNERRSAGDRVYGLQLEEARYFVRGPFDGDAYGPRSYRRLLEGVDSAPALAVRLASWGVTYLLVDRAEAPAFLGAVDDPSLPRLRDDDAVAVHAVRPRAGGE